MSAKIILCPALVFLASTGCALSPTVVCPIEPKEPVATPAKVRDAEVRLACRRDSLEQNLGDQIVHLETGLAFMKSSQAFLEKKGVKVAQGQSSPPAVILLELQSFVMDARSGGMTSFTATLVIGITVRRGEELLYSKNIVGTREDSNFFSKSKAVSNAATGAFDDAFSKLDAPMDEALQASVGGK